ncbi:MAG: type III secretion system chaperone [Desulfobacterales bacterium]|nr:type III secretion system chaperone [Desulfobacterales bacterium]
MAKENFMNLIAELGNSIGIPNLSIDEDEYCFLKIDETLLITLFRDPDSDFVTVYCEVGCYDDYTQTEIFKAVLEANYFWSGTGGATLGINSEHKTILMAYKQPLGLMDFHHFLTMLQTFINTAEIWIHRIVEITQKGTQDVITDSSTLPLHGVMV